MTLLSFALVFAVYLSLDFSNPLMPGAVTFGDGESVEARQGERPRGVDGTPPPLPTPVAPQAAEPQFVRMRQPSRDVSRVWQTCLRQCQPAPSGSSSPSEDA